MPSDAEEARAAAEHVLEDGVMGYVAVDQREYSAFISERLIAEETGASARVAKLARKLLLSRHKDELPGAVSPSEVEFDA